jgi:spermidine synthase
MSRSKLTLEIFLIALAIILIEVAYTRVFSFKLVYYFTYVIIAIALLGLGTGGVLVAMFGRLRRAEPAMVLIVCCLAGGTSVLVSYLVIANTQLNSVDLVAAVVEGDLASVLREGGKLVGICLSLFAPFLAGGLAIATIFSTQTARINRLYFADLLGAGLGCTVVVPLMFALSPPGCIILAGAIFASAGLRLAARSRRLLATTAALSGLLFLAALSPQRLPDPVVDRIKTMSPDESPVVLFSRWSPVFRIDVVESLFGPETAHVLSHDGMWGSVLPRYNGDPASLSRYDDDERAYPFALLEPDPRVVIIGSAGGNEILASLHFGAEHVTAVELNPATVQLLTDEFADYTGHLAEDPRVDLVNAEGRSFLASSPDRYDLIWFVAPDSYAAMNAATAGAFVLSESYLYTSEMISESLLRLSENGIICTQFGELDYARKPNRTARYLGTARKAFRELGFEDFSRHVLLATTPGFEGQTSTILLKRAPFTQAEVRRFVQATRKIKGAAARYAWTHPLPNDLLRTVITGSPEDIARSQREYPFDIRPVTDNAPFFWHFVPFHQAVRPLDHLGRVGTEEGMGERLLLVLLVVTTGFGGAFLLAPLLARRQVWRTIPYKGNTAVYFGALGLGFMFLEVSLIQRLTLFLGYPTYSLTVTLFALLVSTGLGSLLSEGAARNRNRSLVLLGGGIAALVAFYVVVLPPLVDVCIGWPMLARAGLTIVLLAPLGLILGVFMPLGLRTLADLSEHPEEYVAWGWAVNGFFSVVSSVLSTVLAMTFGFDVIMGLALGTYALGIVAMLRIPETDPS